MNFSKNKILVPVDIEADYDILIEQSHSIANVFDAEIVLLYVIEESPAIIKFFSPDDYLNRLRIHAKKKFDYIEKLVEKAHGKNHVPVSYIIKKGKVYQQIIETALELSALLIVMGKDAGIQQTNRQFIGGNTFNVIREAHCPVISIEGQKTFPVFKDILVPIDFTGQTKKQVEKAIEFGKYSGANIHLISVMTKEKKINRLLKNVQMKQVRNAIVKNGLNCTTEIFSSEPKKVPFIICEAAKNKSAELIIIMTQQEKRFSRFFVGSIAQEVIFMAGVPVLSISPKVEFKPQIVTSFVDPLGLMNKK